MLPKGMPTQQNSMFFELAEDLTFFSPVQSAVHISFVICTYLIHRHVTKTHYKYITKCRPNIDFYTSH